MRQGKRIFIFDLSEVAAIDSTGIGHFIASYNKIMAAGGDMRMVGATGHVGVLLRISLLDTVFPKKDVAAAGHGIGARARSGDHHGRNQRPPFRWLLETVGGRPKAIHLIARPASPPPAGCDSAWRNGAARKSSSCR